MACGLRPAEAFDVASVARPVGPPLAPAPGPPVLRQAGLPQGTWSLWHLLAMMASVLMGCDGHLRRSGDDDPLAGGCGGAQVQLPRRGIAPACWVGNRRRCGRPRIARRRARRLRRPLSFAGRCWRWLPVLLAAVALVAAVAQVAVHSGVKGSSAHSSACEKVSNRVTQALSGGRGGMGVLGSGAHQGGCPHKWGPTLSAMAALPHDAFEKFQYDMSDASPAGIVNTYRHTHSIVCTRSVTVPLRTMSGRGRGQGVITTAPFFDALPRAWPGWPFRGIRVGQAKQPGPVPAANGIFREAAQAAEVVVVDGAPRRGEEHSLLWASQDAEAVEGWVSSEVGPIRSGVLRSGARTSVPELRFLQTHARRSSSPSLPRHLLSRQL